jgi:hypothetical protein
MAFLDLTVRIAGVGFWEVNTTVSGSDNLRVFILRAPKLPQHPDRRKAASRHPVQSLRSHRLGPGVRFCDAEWDFSGTQYLGQIERIAKQSSSELITTVLPYQRNENLGNGGDDRLLRRFYSPLLWR